VPLSILIYHRVLSEPDALFPGEVDAVTFNQQMRLISSCLQVMPLRDAVKRLREGKLPARAACITFDDGYADNAEVALPILNRYNVPATFFVATGFLNGGRMWNDTVIESVRSAPGGFLELSEVGLGRHQISTTAERQRAISTLLGKLKYLPLETRNSQVEKICSTLSATLPTDLMMTSDQVRALHNAGMEIGGHTVSHPILARLDHATARSEIANGKEALEHIVGAPVRLFAYPNGKPGQDYLPEHVEMVREIGFDATVSTAWGAANAGSDLHQLPRFTPWDKGPGKFMLRLARNMFRSPQRV
jgi:peptidoglycan/xylan/chitin deacetylase (PgdA/CDA1 family)